MAFISTYTHGTPYVSADGDGYVSIGIASKSAYLIANFEDAERLHMQLGEVLAKLRASNDEGPTAPAAQVAA